MSKGLELYYAKFGVGPPWPVNADPVAFDELCAQAASRGEPINDDDIKALFANVPDDALI